MLSRVTLFLLQDEIEQVILVGGATRVPKVQEVLLKAVGKYVWGPGPRLGGWGVGGRGPAGSCRRAGTEPGASTGRSWGRTSMRTKRPPWAPCTRQLRSAKPSR